MIMPLPLLQSGATRLATLDYAVLALYFLVILRHRLVLLA